MVKSFGYYFITLCVRENDCARELSSNFRKADLRKSPIRNMKELILEVGKNLTFIDEEFRVQVGGEVYKIDLLFFHRGLQCLVAFEFKIG